MRLERLYVENFQGLVHADLDLSTPITLVAGANGAGKSSLKEAIGLALGESARVNLKKDYTKLVTEGQKKAQIILGHDGVASSFTLPSGKAERQNIPGSEYLPYVINPPAFAALDDKGRRKLLFALTKSSARPDTVAGLLLNRGANPAKVETIKPLLLSGFSTAQEQAKTNASESRGAWKALTGDTYGSEKAEGWSVVLPEGKTPTAAELKAVMTQHDEAIAEVEKGLSFLGGLEAKISAAGSHEARKLAAGEKAALLDRRKAKQATTEKELSGWESKLADMTQRLATLTTGADGSECPSCGTKLKIVGNQLELHQGLKGDVKARSDLALDLTKARDAAALLKRTLQNDMAAVAEAQVAAKLLAEINAEKIEVVDASLIERTEAGITAMRLKSDQLRAKYNALQDLKLIFDGANETNAKASAHHQDVKDWTLIEKALAPDGLPGEILGGALRPFNTALAKASALSAWPKTQIDAAMNITAGGRLYGLLSESEKWRVDTLIALVIAQQSGLRMVVLDRYDVLDVPARGRLMGMLLAMVKAGELESSVVCGTLKEKPRAENLPVEIQSVWIADGLAGEKSDLQKAS